MELSFDNSVLGVTLCHLRYAFLSGALAAAEGYSSAIVIVAGAQHENLRVARFNSSHMSYLHAATDRFPFPV